MRWKGMAVGALVGGRLMGPLGALLGAALGYAAEGRLRSGARRPRGGGAASARRPRGALAAAYETLGVPPTASDEEVRRAYRRQAKRCHPDALRARGLPESSVAKATERMARVNAAWGEIKSARGI